MNGGRLILSIIVGFVFIFASDYLIHAVWLAGDYKLSAALWRPEDEMHRRFIILLAAQLLASIAFLYIWARTGWRRRSVIDGCSFGFFMGLFQQVTTLVIYVVMPFPLNLAIKWFFAGLLQAILLGALASRVYKPRPILGDRKV